MVNFCIGSNRSRLVLATTRFYPPEELFDMLNHRTTSEGVSVEYGPNLFAVIENEQELRLACRMVAADHASYISEADYQQHLSDQAESAHTDKFEKYLADARKARRTARRMNNAGTRACSAPPDEATSTLRGRDHSTRDKTRPMHETPNDASSNSC